MFIEFGVVLIIISVSLIVGAAANEAARNYFQWKNKTKFDKRLRK